MNTLEGFEFINGSGRVSDKQLCVMTAVAYLAGEKHSDHPECACPVLTSLGIRLNDGPYWESSSERTAALVPLAHKLVGSRSTPEVERKRRDILVHAALTEFAPNALDSAASVLELRGKVKLRDYAARLRVSPSADLAREARDAAAYAAAYAAAAADAAYAAASYAAYAAAYAAQASFSAKQKARAEARRGVRERLLQLMDECLAVQP